MIPDPPRAPAAPGRPAPLTDPADLWTLLGRFCASLILTTMTIVNLFAHHYLLAAFTGIASFLFQRAAIRLWRRLRDERIEKSAARSGADG